MNTIQAGIWTHLELLKKINLKSRLSIAYRNETGRTFQEYFSVVNEYCKSVGIKPNHSKAYHKKKERVYKDFVTSRFEFR